MKISRISHKEVDDVLNSQQEMIENISIYTEEITRKTREFLENKESIKGIFHFIMHGLFSYKKQDIKENMILQLDESDMAEFAAEKMIKASELLVESIMIGTVMALAQKKAMEVSEEGNA